MLPLSMIFRVRRLGLLLVALGLSSVLACEDLPPTDTRVALTCGDYCDKANECNDDVDVDECKADCEDTMNDCMADEQRHALDDLDGCAEDSCGDFAACTIGAGLQCSFGI